MSNTDGEDTQKVSLGELLLNAGTRIVDLEKQSNDQVEIIMHLEKQLASLREQLANSRDEVHELNVQTDNLNNELLMTKELLKQKEDENRELVEILNALQPWISGIGWIHHNGDFFDMTDRIKKAKNLSASAKLGK